MKAILFREVAHLVGSSIESYAVVRGFAVDSRLAKPGDLFFALAGAQTDGHAFLSEVASKGAAGAVVHANYTGPDYGLPLMRSQNVFQTLQHMAKAYLQIKSIPIVAVTGSLGKTTTKDFIGKLLKNKYKTFVSPGNSNSQTGLPLSILNRITLDEDILVLEMGMTHAGEIAKLIEIAPPKVAVITMVALVHAGFFDSIEGIARAKAEVLSHPSTELGIYHFESDYGNILSQSSGCRKLSFSTSMPQADLYLCGYADKIVVKEGSAVSAELPLLSLPGMHNRHNFLAAIAVARYFGISWEEIRKNQASLVLPERRLEFIEKFGALFINDAYNASEVSTKAALASLPQPQKGAKSIVVFGGMVELGKFSEQCHRAVGEQALLHVDLLFCFGDDCLPIVDCWKAAGRPVFWAKEREGIIESLRAHVQPGDVILLKGSRLKGVWKVLDEL